MTGSDPARARLVRLIAAAAAAAATLLAAAPPASATYAAQLVSACCYATLEPGDTLENYYSMRNTGDETWYRDGAIPVRVGTGVPRNHASPFYTAGDWINSGRPTGLDSEKTLPGEVGRFTWIATAPQQVGDYTEYYEPVAEFVTWMAPEGSLYFKYTIIPAQAPTLRITAVPARVKRGDAITVSADATDNRGISRVTFATGTQVVNVTAPTAGTSGYTATLNSSELGRNQQRSGPRLRPRRPRELDGLGVRGLRGARATDHLDATRRLHPVLRDEDRPQRAPRHAHRPRRRRRPTARQPDQHRLHEGLRAARQRVAQGHLARPCAADAAPPAAAAQPHAHRAARVAARLRHALSALPPAPHPPRHARAIRQRRLPVQREAPHGHPLPAVVSR